jgi:hypothetical protein
VREIMRVIFSFTFIAATLRFMLAAPGQVGCYT